MSVKLRELIREVRQCKSASAERGVIAKELANIRTAIKIKDKLEYRHRNVAKLMYCDMLGYPTHFGQMEVLKLLASKPFVEKRLGYLALMQLLDENTEVLMLSTQSLKQDMCHENPFIVGLALCAMGNIASTDISRDLARELEKLLKHSNPYIRKKALCTAIRVINRVPEMCEEYFKCAVGTLEDSGQGHGPTVAAVQLIYAICKKRSKHIKKLRKCSGHIISRLSSLLRSSYDPDHDIGGVTDPFLQVYLLKLLRLISTGDKKLSDDVDSTLAQIATNTESNKNPGNSILYECVRTIMSIEKQSSLHVLAINILGRFLVNRDNNVRYVALNALCNAVTSNTDAIQRHRNTIVECLKDADLTIRKRALDLIYALTNKKNIRSLARDLLNFLTISNTTTTFEAVAAPKGGDEKESSKEFKKGKKGKKKRQEKAVKQVMVAKADEDGKPILIAASSLSAGELEFRQELASKICMVVERYAPTRKWHIDRIIQVMATTTNTGFNREQEVVENLFILVSNTRSLQAYCTYKLYECISKLQLNSDPIRQITSWLIGEYGDRLMDAAACHDANEELMRDKKSNDEDEESPSHASQSMFENMTLDIGPFAIKTTDEILAMLKYVIKDEKSTVTTKGLGLTALMKIRHKYQLQNIDKDEKINSILEQFKCDKQIEVQQRSIEFCALFEHTEPSARNKILKAMPVPKIERIFTENKATMRQRNESDTDTNTESEEEEEEESEKSDDEEESDKSSEEESGGKSSESESESESASDSESEDKGKRGKKKEREKRRRELEREKKRKLREREREKERKKRKGKGKKKGPPVIPVLLGPDEAVGGNAGNANVNGGTAVAVAVAERKVNGEFGREEAAVNTTDLLSFGGQSGHGSGGDLLGDLLSGMGGQSAVAVANSGGSGDLLGDLDLLGSGARNSGGSNTAAMTKPAPFEAYNKNGISATFNFAPTQGQGVCRVLAVFHNSNAFELSDFSFMIAVPKYIKLQFKPANGTKLLALSQNSVTQKFQLTNTVYGQKPFIIRVQVIYTANGQKMQHRSQVQFPDNCC